MLHLRTHTYKINLCLFFVSLKAGQTQDRASNSPWCCHVTWEEISMSAKQFRATMWSQNSFFSLSTLSCVTLSRYWILRVFFLHSQKPVPWDSFDFTNIFCSCEIEFPNFFLTFPLGKNKTLSFKYSFVCWENSNKTSDRWAQHLLGSNPRTSLNLSIPKVSCLHCLRAQQRKEGDSDLIFLSILIDGNDFLSDSPHPKVNERGLRKKKSLSF